MGGIIDTINLISMMGVRFLTTGEDFGIDQSDMSNTEVALNNSFAQIMEKLQELINEIWIWVIVGLAAVVVVWGAYIGIRIAIAHRNEEKINSRDMLKNLFIGIIIIFVIALGVPLIIEALALWVG